MHANAMRAAQKAMELDPGLVDARLLLAEIGRKQYQWAEAEAEYKRAIELAPNNPGAHFGYASLLSSQGRADEAMSQAQRGSELDPPVNRGEHFGELLFAARRYDEAMREYRDLLAVGTDEANALWSIGLVLMAKHQYDQAVPVLEKAVAVSNRSPGIVGGLIMAYAQAGRRSDALRLLAELKEHERPGYSGAFVYAYLGLGDYDEAFAWLDRAYQEQANIMQNLKVFPCFDPVRDDLRFQDLLRRVGLN
jgi:tetratricopeptide (TPR) repeat protein